MVVSNHWTRLTQAISFTFSVGQKLKRTYSAY